MHSQEESFIIKNITTLQLCCYTSLKCYFHCTLQSTLQIVIIYVNNKIRERERERTFQMKKTQFTLFYQLRTERKPHFFSFKFFAVYAISFRFRHF